MSVLTEDLTYTSNTDSDYERWMNDMLSGEDSGEYVARDAEDEDWNENIFLDEEEDEEIDVIPSVSEPVKAEEPVSATPEESSAPKTRDARKCREWAQSQGMEIGKRGVIAAEIWDAYLVS